MKIKLNYQKFYTDNKDTFDNYDLKMSLYVATKKLEELKKIELSRNLVDYFIFLYIDNKNVHDLNKKQTIKKLTELLLIDYNSKQQYSIDKQTIDEILDNFIFVDCCRFSKVNKYLYFYYYDFKTFKTIKKNNKKQLAKDFKKILIYNQSKLKNIDTIKELIKTELKQYILN